MPSLNQVTLILTSWC